MLVLEEINLRGDKIIYNHVWVGNVWSNIPKDQPRALEGGPILGVKTVPGIPKPRRHQRLVGLSTPPPIGVVGRDIDLEGRRTM